MSINAMTNAALARRADYPPNNNQPQTSEQRAQAAINDPIPTNKINTALTTLTTYVPTETLTLYVALTGALQPTPPAHIASVLSRWIAFWIFFVFTPLAIWIAFAAKLVHDNKQLPLRPSYWPKWEMVAGTIAYTAWAIGLPNTPFSEFPWYSGAIAGFVVLIISTVLSMIAGLFQKPLNAAADG